MKISILCKLSLSGIKTGHSPTLSMWLTWAVQSVDASREWPMSCSLRPFLKVSVVRREQQSHLSLCQNGPGYMNEPELCDTLSVQSEYRSGYMKGRMEKMDFSFWGWNSKKKKILNPVVNKMSDSNTYYFNCYFSHIYFFQFLSYFVSLPLSHSLWLSGSPTKFQPVMDCVLCVKGLVVYKAIIVN